MKSLLKILYNNIKYTNDHVFEGNICSNCKRTIEQLFWELIDKENPEILRYIYKVQALGNDFIESERNKIVIKNHKQCLTNDELMIRDIIQ
jgi:hypothetical protein